MRILLLPVAPLDAWNIPILLVRRDLYINEFFFKLVCGWFEIITSGEHSLRCGDTYLRH